MTRAKPMTRTPFARRTAEQVVDRLMARQRTRLRRVSKKTRAERWPVLKALRAHVLARAKGRCECRLGGNHYGALECHHAVKRSQRRDDSADNVVALCKDHHARTDNPFIAGRLVVTPLGHESFRFEIVWARDKWAARQP